MEALIKCKMQDNLEFLQWTKRYWDQYYPGDDYDALARRKASGGPPAAAPPARAPASSAARRAVTSSNTAAPRTRTPQGSVASAALQQENNTLKETVTGLERERDFYFNKLRDIELLIQQAIEEDPELDKDEGLLKKIQTILYSTEVTILFFAGCALRGRLYFANLPRSCRRDSRFRRRQSGRVPRKRLSRRVLDEKRYIKLV